MDSWKGANLLLIFLFFINLAAEAAFNDTHSDSIMYY